MKQIFIIICMVAICYSCNHKTKIADLKYGEKITIAEQAFCDKIINTNPEDTIIIEGKQYRTQRECALIKGISGSIDYQLSDGEKEFEVSIVSNESSMIPISAIVKRVR